MLGAPACSRDNPDFQQGTGDGTTGRGTSATSATSATSDDTVRGSSTGGSDDETETTSGRPDVGITSCVPSGGPFVVELTIGDETMAPRCDVDDGVVEIVGEFNPVPDGLRMHECEGCPCTRYFDDVDLYNDNAVEFPPYEGCGHLVVWAAPSDGGCQWVGFALLNEDGFPLHMATSGLDSPYGDPWVTDLVVRDECDGAMSCPGSRPPGTYALQFGTTLVKPGDGPTEVNLQWDTDLAFIPSVRAIGASIAEDCRRNLLWMFTSPP